MEAVDDFSSMLNTRYEPVVVLRFDLPIWFCFSDVDAVLDVCIIVEDRISFGVVKCFSMSPRVDVV
jgi:hypothetical protein